ncbi:triose-phosphate isomerase [Coprothermobacteraceae bacterium]|nr:triose-phosphate isomerase [Coprothermobacteraceae bacterium]
MRFVFGNWKMNGTVEFGQNYLGQLLAMPQPANVQVAVFPPFTLLHLLGRLAVDTHILIGAQNMHWEDQGAYTGEISPVMLKDLGVSYVILGHSERRQHFGESDEALVRKLQACRRNGLNAVLCVGETFDQRKSGSTFDVLKRQLVLARESLSPGDLIAYEPVWAIGTGVTPTLQEIDEAMLWIKEFVGNTVPVLYGGSVSSKNAVDIAGIPSVDGALVGGASLKLGEFASIIEAFSKNS